MRFCIILQLLTAIAPFLSNQSSLSTTSLDLFLNVKGCLLNLSEYLLFRPRTDSHRVQWITDHYVKDYYFFIQFVTVSVHYKVSTVVIETYFIGKLLLGRATKNGENNLWPSPVIISYFQSVGIHFNHPLQLPFNAQLNSAHYSILKTGDLSGVWQKTTSLLYLLCSVIKRQLTTLHLRLCPRAALWRSRYQWMTSSANEIR